MYGQGFVSKTDIKINRTFERKIGRREGTDSGTINSATKKGNRKKYLLNEDGYKNGKIINDGIEVDSIYEELMSEYPDFFDKDGKFKLSARENLLNDSDILYIDPNKKGPKNGWVVIGSYSRSAQLIQIL